MGGADMNGQEHGVEIAMSPASSFLLLLYNYNVDGCVQLIDGNCLLWLCMVLLFFCYI